MDKKNRKEREKKTEIIRNSELKFFFVFVFVFLN
jgi:hypothetical protein